MRPHTGGWRACYSSIAAFSMTKRGDTCVESYTQLPRGGMPHMRFGGGGAVLEVAALTGRHKSIASRGYKAESGLP